LGDYCLNSVGRFPVPVDAFTLLSRIGAGYAWFRDALDDLLEGQYEDQNAHVLDSPEVRCYTDLLIV
jgi:hypothetical protein